MKSKEVIRQLQEADPSGEAEVCVNNEDIHFINREAAYWDGCLQVLVRDESKKDCYNIIGVRYVSDGDKISIHTLGVGDVLLDDSDAPIDYSGLNESQAARYRESDEREREENRQMCRKLELDLFLQWADDKVKAGYPPLKAYFLQAAAEEFFDRNISPKDPLPPAEPRKEKDGLAYPSYNDRRRGQWDDTVRIGWDGEGNFKFSGVQEKQSPIS